MKKWCVIFTGVVGVLLTIAGIVSKIRKALAVTIIGGADGPTSVFIAGKLGSDFSIGMIVIGIILVAITIFMVRKLRKK